jgi:ElaB/YqjD/DUF883 family membrane-anchored ribosome-binding protein
MSRRSRNGHFSKEIAEIEGLLHDLDARLSRVTKTASREANGATSDIGDAIYNVVANILSDTVQRLRDGTHEVTSDMAERFRDGTSAFVDEAATLGSAALRKITQEVETRPVRTLAVAAGIGYLVGLVGRRH